ncbi:trypsin-like serine protease [Dorcoceras hygrometricum]|uniref:Trypsin-like serine protease n=1 Tax=Dorcoceras hygrometricum TaxID=472368 RepID=A0A2Z7BD36_9LAMI|nr:trypsin-like serine protease [Dorcoceras hygrometricum]
MLAGNTTREVESDTVAEQELKTVKRVFGGLNEGIWPKSSLAGTLWTSCCVKMKKDQLENKSDVDQLVRQRCNSDECYSNSATSYSESVASYSESVASYSKSVAIYSGSCNQSLTEYDSVAAAKTKLHQLLRVNVPAAGS